MDAESILILESDSGFWILIPILILDSGGSLGGARSVEKLPGSVFLRFLSAKYTYFQGLEHVNFVNFMWSLEAPGPS